MTARLGRVISHAMRSTSVSPNTLAVVGLGGQALGAGLVATAPVPVPVGLWLSVILLWQLALGVSAAGQLRRSRGVASAFGAWLETFFDVVGRVIVYLSLVLFIVRSLGLGGVESTILATIVLGFHVIQLSMDWEHRLMLVDLAEADARAGLQMARPARHLLDYGFFLLSASVLALWPIALLVFAVASSILHLLSAVIQLGLSWSQHLATTRAARNRGGRPKPH